MAAFFDVTMFEPYVAKKGEQNTQNTHLSINIPLFNKLAPEPHRSQPDGDLAKSMQHVSSTIVIVRLS